ncbi:PREDICTED: LOW QUALITY PROTEIN: centrosome-associated protein 350-like [Gekko japonicus]|uniref:LOW QUALITY PROTEIN: centrosome-associated protein 350-like n=1 Tax=Gekko japonicus TaxID=146911 RepID=A0ABM1KZ27_GEKJA|nr:PREDICTED: LOW QUALITY PROTEIN: centrosome-associated protein 350-like [Gekko japonicus]
MAFHLNLFSNYIIRPKVQQHKENKLEVAPIRTAVLDYVMDAKKPSASITRKRSKKACRSSSQKMERSPHCPVPATALDNSMKKKSNFECSEASASFRDTKGSPSYKSSCQSEANCLKHKARNKAEGASHMAYEKDEPDLQNRDFKSPSSVDETVVRYLNDRPAIDALQNSDPFLKGVTPTSSKEEKTEGSRDEYAKMSLSITIPDAELKDPQLAESSASSSSTSSTHRLAILKHRQHDAKMEKLKGRIRKQWRFQEDLNSREQFQDYVDHPVIVAATENTVTPKLRKVTATSPSPAYKDFSPSEAKIYTPDEKVRHEEEFLSLSRELCRDLERQLEEEDSVFKDKPAERRKKKKSTGRVRKVQKVTELPGHYSKPGRFSIISTSSWRDGKRLAMKILGPAPKVKKQTSPSIDGSCSDRSIKSAFYMGKTESDSMQDVAIKSRSRNPKRSWSKMRRKNSLRRRDAAVQDNEQSDHHINKDVLSGGIQDIPGDLQVDSVTHTKQETDGENQNSEVPAAFTRSHSPTKKKMDQLAANKEPQVTYKKCHYDTDEVRQYLFKQRQERSKKQSEQKKAQKEATLEREKRLQEPYKKQREALANKPKSASAPELVPKQLQETSSKLFLDQALLEEPQPPLIQDVQPNPGYHPFEDSNKEDKVQGHPASTSSNSDMSLSEPHHSLVRDDWLEPLGIQPDNLGIQLPFPHSSTVFTGGLFSQRLSLDHGVLKKDFDCLLSTRSHSTAIGFLPLSSPPVTSTLQPTGTLDRIEALKAKAASLSSRIESEAKRLAGIGMDYGAVCSPGHNSVQGNQGDGYWVKASSPLVREENDAFSATFQNMSSICASQTIFDNHLPELENPGMGKTISPHAAAAVSLPCKQTFEGIAANLSKKQNSPNAESIVILHEQWLGDHLLSEEDGEQDDHSPLKITETLKEKEFCGAGKTGDEPTEQFQKEAENYLPISAQMRSASGPWEEITKGSPHSVITIFRKSNQLCGQGFEERSRQGSPLQQPSLPVMSPPASIVSYEDDFISSQGSGMGTDKKTAVEPSSIPNLKEELINRKLPYELQVKEFTHHSSGTPSSSSCSSSYPKRIGEKERLKSFTGVSHFSLWEENRMFTESDHALLETKTSVPSNGVSSREQIQNPDSDNTLEELFGHNLMSLPDKIRSPRTASCPQSPRAQKELEPVAEQSRSSSRSQATIFPGPKPNLAFPDMNLGAKRTGTGVVSDSMHFSLAGLQHQILAELHYLSTIEESLQQLSDVKQAPGISLVQQESVSLAQILTDQRKKHEGVLALLKLKADEVALKEAQQKAAQPPAESLQQLVQCQEDAAGALQETTTCKIAAQQMEAALLTTAAAWQIRKLTEIACAQNPDAVTIPANPVPLPLDQKQKRRSTVIKKVKARSDISRKTESVTPSQNKETGDSKQTYSPSFDSCSESSRSKAHDESSSGSSSHQESPSVPFPKETKEVSHHEKSNSSIEKEGLTAVNNSLQTNSIPSIPDERDSTSVATEYSLKFDSMTEDEMEEKSFRSLLPSESHRRISLKKHSHHGYPDQEASSRKMPLSQAKELSLPFSGGQNSFSKFTMEMVRQYMKEEEMRAAHQSSLLQLRKKALKEKTKAELAWLELQEKHLRDKGEDDKMPPIWKRQRGLILKLQQEKAEIKCLQEANKAAQKERQLILKQQEEIQRICQTTTKLQEKLKSAVENKLEPCSEGDAKRTHSPSPLPVDAETCSPSSASSSETHSIMQKLKKMHSRVDKKFLTKREQKLMQRRQHAEELLQWKCRLDTEEAEICQIERHALAAWDKKLLETKANKMAAGDQHDQKETANEEDSSAPPCSRFNNGSSVPEELGNLAVESGPPKVSEVQGQLGSPDHTALMEGMVYVQEIESSASPGKLSPSKSRTSLSKQGSSKQTHRARGQQHLPVKSQEVSCSWSDESLSITQSVNLLLSETSSDQSDIESRIQALKNELRNRKSVVYQLIKEQKKRHKARLKAQEASLVKQLETYDEFIKKTEAELSHNLEAAPTAKLQIKTPSFVTEEPKIKPPPLHRPERTRRWKSLTDSVHCKGSPESLTEHIDAVSLSERSDSSHPKKFIEAEIQTEEHFRALSPVLAPQKAGAESGDSLDGFPSLAVLKDLGDLYKMSHVSQSTFEDATSHDLHISTDRSVVQEEVEPVKSGDSEPDGTHKFSGRPDASGLDTEQKNGLTVLLKMSTDPEMGLAVVCVQDGKEIPKWEESYRDEKCAASGQSSQKLDETLLSEQLAACTETRDPNGFERSSSRKRSSDDGAPNTECYKDDFDTSVSSLGKDSRSHGEKPWHTKTPRSRSASIGSDKEVSDCLCDNVLSVASSVPSERLLILNSPRELMESKERSDVEGESTHLDSSLWASSCKAEEEESPLQDFSIGDRVLVGNVQPGTLRFKGLTDFAEGFWAGVELDKPEGKNNGTYGGIKYFDCRGKHGIFAPPRKISRISEHLGGLVDTKEHSFCPIQLRSIWVASWTRRGKLMPVNNKKVGSTMGTFLLLTASDSAAAESPVFGASGQEELAKSLAGLERSQEFLSVLGDDRDWFDEDFGLSTHELPLKQAEESAVLPKIEPPKVSSRLCEPPLGVPYTAKEVEVLVHEAAEELWKCKELGRDLQAAGFPRDLSDSPKDDIKAISKQIYKQAVFDLTRETFGEIFAEDPNLSQPVWTNPCRITSTYFHRVKDPSNPEEVKSFIATEVLKLLNWKKEPSNRVGWQKMIKCGHKKYYRVNQVLLQELHEEEVQWMNYEEEALYVKMHLADGIFEALIRETIDVLNQIKGKQDRLLPM